LTRAREAFGPKGVVQPVDHPCTHGGSGRIQGLGDIERDGIARRLFWEQWTPDGRSLFTASLDRKQEAKSDDPY